MFDIRYAPGTKPVYRIDVECFMELFDCSQTKAYIAKLLHYAGGNEQIFSDFALKKIYDYSSGLPRMINRACTLWLTRRTGSSWKTGWSAKHWRGEVT